MRTYEERVREMHRRAEDLLQKRKQRRYRIACVGVYAACAAVVFLAALGVSRIRLSEDISQTVPGGSAGIFANSGAIGYVFVACLAFALGIAATLFCSRLKRRLDAEKEFFE